MAARHSRPGTRTASTRTRLTWRGKAVSGLAVTTLVGTALWAWPASGDDHDKLSAGQDDRPRAAAPGSPGGKGGHGLDVRASGDRNAPTGHRRIPGLSDATRQRIPAASRQVLVVTGKGPDAHDAEVVLYTRAEGSDDWRPGAAWPAHNASRGWTKDHRYGDLRSPQGVFTLTDAGGKLAPPKGTKLPYDRNDHFVAHGTGVEGEPLEGAFDYVIAINYNRVPGTSPLDGTRPLGAKKGGGVWLHVDHGGPTQGCVSLRPEVMRELLRTLDPAQHPVIVMGPAGH
ncbi:L,D-transpeptidase family protein [Streptomyces sp. MST-110588]|uniref:L,D-transpeptidase family protein n=1 Tax=Streptomyces sp. MST-110588 TaxID=2833628 RepID=UPI001F5E1858|nr:L,D-transpeptidase family protein [Streptomyces sp. MST-110588]UNO41508.1 L,D-transpeptidase family protein [Streptomyces sp. MST-110588]